MDILNRLGLGPIGGLSVIALGTSCYYTFRYKRMLVRTFTLLGDYEEMVDKLLQEKVDTLFADIVKNYE
jgi:hypothetical protein